MLLKFYLALTFFSIVAHATPSMTYNYPIFTVYVDNFPPYSLGTNPPFCKIQRIYLKEEKGESTFRVFRYIDNGNRYKIILDSGKSRDMKRGGFWITKLTILKNNIPILENEIVAIQEPDSAIVFWSYLNEDDKKDIIIAFPTLPSPSPDKYYVTFLLSDKNQYHVSRIHTYAISQNLFYDYNDDGKCEFLQLESFPRYVISKKGPSYLVYNIMQFTKSSFKYNNKLSRYFPRWMVFKSTEINHYPDTNNHATKFPESITNLFWGEYLKKWEDINRQDTDYYGLSLDLEPVKEKLKQINE